MAAVEDMSWVNAQYEGDSVEGGWGRAGREESESIGPEEETGRWGARGNVLPGCVSGQRQLGE